MPQPVRKPKVRDPLADHLARGRIDQAQYRAAREFQRQFTLADKRRPDALTDGQDAAWKALACCYRALGADGSALVNDVLIDGKTTRQVKETRGKKGLAWEQFYFRRLWECLNTLTAVYGFERRPNFAGALAKSPATVRQQGIR